MVEQGQQAEALSWNHTARKIQGAEEGRPHEVEGWQQLRIPVGFEQRSAPLAVRANPILVGVKHCQFRIVFQSSSEPC
jgi:hypothetical protein